MNNNIFLFFYNLAHKKELFDGLVVFFADIFPYIIILLVFIFLFFYHKSWKEFFLVFFTSSFAWFIAYILKILIQIPRPFLSLENVSPLLGESSFAFPSGHATFFMALAFSIFFLNKKIGFLFIFFALLIGIARIIAGVHFPMDILGGFILGFIMSFLVKYVSNKFAFFGKSV